MSGTAGSWVIRADPRTGIYLVRFRVAGARVQRSTGERVRARASTVAAQMYARALVEPPIDTERAPVPVRAPAISRDLRERDPQPAPAPISLRDAADRWLESLHGALHARTIRTYELYTRTHWARHFETLDAIDDRSCAELVRARLASVKRKTLLKELAALRGFTRWMVGAHLLEREPVIRSPDRRAVGTEHDGGRRRRQLVELSPAEVEAILAAIPVRSSHGHPARAFFTTMYETGLRYSTVTSLRAPDDYARGSRELVVRDEIDKARFGRRLPLTMRAAEALDEVCPDEGPIFGRIELRGVLKAAGAAAGLAPHRARHLGYHTLRHARLTHLGERTRNLAGLAYLAGHRHVTTTALYVHAGRRAATELLAELDDEEDPADRGNSPATERPQQKAEREVPHEQGSSTSHPPPHRRG